MSDWIWRLLRADNAEVYLIVLVLLLTALAVAVRGLIYGLAGWPL